MKCYCPKCGLEMERIEGELNVNIVGGWLCEECNEFIPEWDVDDDED